MMRKIEMILVHPKTGKKYLVKDLHEDFHTSDGVISSTELLSGKNELKSSKGVCFFSLVPSFVDLWEGLQRGPQVIIQKDIGLIIAKTGVNGNSRVVDAGGGSGSLCLALANICKEVTAYEINDEHYHILEKNQVQLKIKNVHLKRADVYNGIAEKELDLVTLDVPEPWKATVSATKALKAGGFLVVYAPQLTQVKAFLDSLPGTGLHLLETVELLERKWKIEDKIMRPEHEMLGHTAFLVFCRKL